MTWAQPTPPRRTQSTRSGKCGADLPCEFLRNDGLAVGEVDGDEQLALPVVYPYPRCGAGDPHLHPFIDQECAAALVLNPGSHRGAEVKCPRKCRRRLQG